MSAVDARKRQAVILVGVTAVVAVSAAGWWLAGYWLAAVVELALSLVAGVVLAQSGVWHAVLHDWPISPGWCPRCRDILYGRRERLWTQEDDL